ncbi:MAG: hypothetical protein LUH56_00255 [Oscillospiraceae bacterium]|nr:hypothetical protein [Oscillospiraceae bacterium]
MFVFKVSWIPYILLIAGIGFISDDQVLPGLVFIVIGILLIWNKHKDKDRSEKHIDSKNEKSQPRMDGYTVNKDVKSGSEKVEEVIKVCSNCGKK